jgi:hypothetical protein
MRRLLVLVAVGTALLMFGLIVLGTLNPTATADRNVPGKTTGAGKSNLTE